MKNPESKNHPEYNMQKGNERKPRSTIIKKNSKKTKEKRN